MYRLYIDETGNSDLEASRNPNHRYLSLTGVIMHLRHVRDEVIPRLDALKHDVFNHDPDDPIILHRKDILNRSRPFHVLRNPELATQFDETLFGILEGCDYVVLTAVIDKLDHLNRYRVWRHDPYHYCLEVLVERYVRWLQDRNERGDVIGEVRGGKPDRRLEAAYADLYQRGNGNIHSALMRQCLTSSKLKLKPKSKNIAGLQLADILAHPSAQYVRSQNAGDVEPRGYGKRVSDLLVNNKYRRSPWNGRVPGWGTKWLP